MQGMQDGKQGELSSSTGAGGWSGCVNSQVLRAERPVNWQALTAVGRCSTKDFFLDSDGHALNHSYQHRMTTIQPLSNRNQLHNGSHALQCNVS